jgi:hypothetical protein
MARARRRVSLASPAATASATTAPSREIIHGIQLQVSGRELVVRVGERMRWHRQRADLLIEQLPQLKEGDEPADGSRAALLVKKLRDHQQRAAFLTFLRDHLNEEAVYRLDSVDLRMLEMLPEMPW